MNKLDEIFLQIYPVGSMFCSTQSTPPSMGEWELVREDVHEMCETAAKGELLWYFQDYSKEPRVKVNIYIYIYIKG